MSGLLLQGLRDVQQKQYAQWINDSGEQLLKLLNGILEVISADAVNEQDINKEFFDLRQCVQDIIELEMPTAYLKGLELKADVGNNIPKFVYSDRIKIHRVMLNLLGNAIKFTDKGTVLISVQLLERNNQQAKIRFSVSDTGIGIFQEQQARVFERFHKVTPSSKGLYTGYGVGLHIVMAYVQLLGGEIKLNSNPGEGTTFGFDLDLECLSHHILNATTNTTMEPVDKENNAQIIVNKSYHVLLVEDNIIALKVAEALARHLGCLITCASDGEEAFTLIQTMAFDLIITDIGLPGMSGYELTQSIRTWELKNNKKVTTIIGLTAHSYEFAKDHCFASGMNEVYSKPMTAELMNSIIETHLLIQYTAQHATQGVVGRLGDELPDREEELFNLTIFPFLDSDKAIKTIGNEGLVKQVLQLMISDAIPKDIAAIEAAHLDAHWDEVKQLAHKMKGGAVYVGTVKMQYACMYLERYQKAGHASLLEPLYQQLITVVQATQDHIRTWLKNN
jgi:CheY-like chemotaxis protein